MPVVVVVTYRDDELAANAALALLVGDLVTAPVVRRIALRALSADGVRTLAAPAGVDAARAVPRDGREPVAGCGVDRSRRSASRVGA